MIVLDTHRFVKRLIAAGFTEEQAEVLVEEQVNLLLARLAHKDDTAAAEAASGSRPATSPSGSKRAGPTC